MDEEKEDIQEAPELTAAAGDWYVLQTMTGQEMKAKESVAKRLEAGEMEEFILETLVPMERVTEVKAGKKTTTNRKLFPGYILMNLMLYDDTRNIHERVWTFIHDTPGIIGFIGGDRPPALSTAEVNDIMDQLKFDDDTAKPRIEYELKEMVKIRDGAFENFEGMIENIDIDRGRLKVSVNIFGRSTPVELEYWQVERTD